MTEVLFVLWVYSAAPQSFHGIPLTGGWVAATVAEESQCRKMLKRMAWMLALRSDREAACLPPERSPRGAIAQIRR